MMTNNQPRPSFRHASALVFRWTLVVAWAAGIFIFSSRENPLGPLSGAKRQLDLPIDQVLHAGEYAGLALLLHWARGADRRTPRSPWITLGLAMAYALFDEAHQDRVPGRTFALNDLACDAAGTVGALTLVRLLRLLNGRGAEGQASEGAEEQASEEVEEQ
jgi:VanZ family protein